MLKYLLKKFGVIYATLLSTGISIVVSVVITSSLMIGFDKSEVDFAIMVSILCPLIIATPISYFWLRLLREAHVIRQQLLESNQRLELAFKEVKELSGLLPICASCKKIRDDQGYWNQLESFIETRSKAEFSHGICPECAEDLYPEFYSKDQGL